MSSTDSTCDMWLRLLEKFAFVMCFGWVLLVICGQDYLRNCSFVMCFGWALLVMCGQDYLRNCSFVMCFGWALLVICSQDYLRVLWKLVSDAVPCFAHAWRQHANLPVPACVMML